MIAIFVTVIENDGTFRRRMVEVNQIESVQGEDTTTAPERSHFQRAELKVTSWEFDDKGNLKSREVEGLLVEESVDQIAALMAQAHKDGVGWAKAKS